ncbi:hypothetical protein QO002_001115 [Pararhizobium capsulatum DSM 1112]|uniref:Uncharacterized protein n=1 Tax=Pararhizobium capsulatum DSM 1112 TaxID=1121113 RepID=A0ABU0BLV2_9HYPH|nr:hypothetical protein [Pararhizobium capsulatum DSM 1112]
MTNTDVEITGVAPEPFERVTSHHGDPGSGTLDIGPSTD